MAMDIEFVSEDRYVPELALVQLAWGDPAGPDIALLDYPAIGREAMAPIFELIERPDIETYSHAARQDLGLLITRFEVRAQGFMDTQIAAAFAGYGEQIGYATLVHKLLHATLDKSPQYTNWLARPLSPEQLHYALADVHYLPAVWVGLSEHLRALGRLDWAAKESILLAQGVRPPVSPIDAYKEIKGWRGLHGDQLGSLAALAAWRQRKALAKNLPPSWILPDKAMVTLCRERADTEQALYAVRGVGKGKVRTYGRAILKYIAEGARTEAPLSPLDSKARLTPRAARWVPMIVSLIQARCASADIPAHWVVERDDIERLAAWFDRRAGTGEARDSDSDTGADSSQGTGTDSGEGESEPDMPLVRGWRREIAGQDVLSWLRGEACIGVSATDAGLVLETHTAKS